jgi:D-lactate dehydrogenase (cytochrome)
VPSDTLIHDLQRLLAPENVSSAKAVLEAHGRDEAFPEMILPDVVVFARSREDVVNVMRYASKHRVPVTPFAVGSSLEGHALARFGGISLDVSGMNQLLELRPHDLLAIVQPGVTYPRLNAAARPHGLFMPVDPGAEASLGGMTATAASGTNAVRYGTMRDFVMGLEVVLASGEVIRTGTQARKSSSGLNLTSLFVGSEGTLGVFTELTIRLVGLPNAVLGAVVTFASIQSAVSSAVSIIQSGVAVARMELVDALSVRAVNRYKRLQLTEAPTLFLEFHGNPAGVREDAELTREICETHGGQGFAHALDPEERSRLWEARHHAWFALKAMFPGQDAFSTDVAVPISRLPESITEAQRLLGEHQLTGTIIGHVGDGNYHALVVADRANPDALARAMQVNEGIVRHAIGLGGTATGEHGVGIRKRKFMALEHGASLGTMQAVKHALDPLGIMNPGKLIDDLETWPECD